MAWFSSFFDVVQCEEQSPQHDEVSTSKPDSTVKDDKGQPTTAIVGTTLPTKGAEEKGGKEAAFKEKSDESDGDEEEEKGDAEEMEDGADAEEEEAEPEDVLPALRESCQSSKPCAPLTHHFQHCQDKVHAGEGFKGEDCVEELCTCSNCAKTRS